MFKTKIKQPIIFIFSLIFLVELLSFLAYFLPAIQIYLLSLVFIIVLVASLKSLETGILIMLTELVIGSKGHLFSSSIFGFNLSLRLIIFLALMVASAIYCYRNQLKNICQEKLRLYKFWPLLIALLFFIGFALVNAILSHNSLSYIFHDLNAWLFIPIILPLILVYFPSYKPEQVTRLLTVFFIAIVSLSVKSLFFLYAFSHQLSIIPDLYLWIRRSGVGEITSMSAGYTRIFIQSQVYLALAIFIILFKAVANSEKRYFKLSYLLTLSLVLSALILSMSRSFWLAIIVAGLIGSILIFRESYRKYFKALIHIITSLAIALIIIFIVIKFPLSNAQQVSLAALGERLDIAQDEAATASRWALLPALLEQISIRPIIGSGFGATVTYHSQDPRVLAQNINGLYTSYAFEWAYLDTWLKLGFFGMLVYLTFIGQILISLWHESKRLSSSIFAALTVTLIFFMMVNVFTPYLNHPLGLAFLLFSSCFVHKNHI